MSRPLHPDVALGVRLSAICSRHRYTHNPQPVIDELLATAGDRVDILATETGSWAGYYDSPDTHTLAAALIAHIPGAADWVQAGRARRAAPIHGTTPRGAPYSSRNGEKPPARSHV